MNPPIDPVSSELGNLRATIDNLTTNWERQDRAATEGRRRLYESVDNFKTEIRESFDSVKSEVRDRMGKVEHTVTQVATDVAEMKPAVQDWKPIKDQAKGAGWATRVLMRAVSG